LYSLSHYIDLNCSTLKECHFINPSKNWRKYKEEWYYEFPEAFYTSPTWEIKAIVRLIPIQFYLDKIISQHHLQITFLSKQHAINSILDQYHSKQYCTATTFLINKQCLKIKSLIIDTNNHLNEIVPLFDSLNKEFTLGFHLVDIFPDYFSFTSVCYKDPKTLVAYQKTILLP